ncbi:RNA polymerase II associated Paf1 family protein [Nitzschia inconspicua]|uniref:RNA polymerase II associated Paf1 family protein n=1 Tax=Nitzschia inconspicua TaxID=303405 RepID=A0A9K3PKW0_9STRA|nr:RNA polymerase II associated Paf1 family protein [Nitzschia inconspicua]
MNQETDDQRHRREEAERRERRKASKSQKSEAQKEKERKRKEHAQKILQQHGGKKQKTSSSNAVPTSSDGTSVSPFQQLFKFRAQGFEISFKFRNAPPRPPVGPCFMGADVDEKLRDLSKYKPLNAVDENHRWKLHTEPDLGVPLAPSAIDPRSYQFVVTNPPPLDPADADLLDWKGSMGDSAAEQLKRMRDDARAKARLALLGKGSLDRILLEKTKTSMAASNESDATRKIFSRVLNEGMQSWMKKTTYMTNDYSRRVHDFKSLAKTKREVEDDLELRQQTITQRRSTAAISKTFDEGKQAVVTHPSKSNVKPVAEMEFLPDESHWVYSYTHVVIEKPPSGGEVTRMKEAIIGNVQQDDVSARMTCELFVKSITNLQEDDTSEMIPYEAVQQYDLDVVPLKEEDAPHISFCIWVNPESGLAMYTPVSSRVHLSGGKPLKNEQYKMEVTRRQINDDDREEMQERLMELETDDTVKGDNNSGDNVDSKGKSTPPSLDDDDSDSDKDASF